MLFSLNATLWYVKHSLNFDVWHKQYLDGEIMVKMSLSSLHFYPLLSFIQLPVLCSELFMAPPELLPVRPTHPQVELSLCWAEALRHFNCKSPLQKRVIETNQIISLNVFITAGPVFNDVCSSFDPKQIIISRQYQTHHSWIPRLNRHTVNSKSLSVLRKTTP